MEVDNEGPLAKNPTPPISDDRNMKRARFDGQETDVNEFVSFKDKLLQQHDDREMETNDSDDMADFALEDGDVSIVDDNGVPSISFSQKVHELLAKPWDCAVIVRMLGRTIGYNTLCSRLAILWKKCARFNIIDLENGYFIVKFSRAVDVSYVLTEGPWVMLGNYLTVQSWSPYFKSTDTHVNSVVAWIRLPGMPLHFYHKKVLRTIAGVIGKVIRIDYNTESASRGKFARIAVELDLTKPLVSQFKIEGRSQKVEYEGLPRICFECGKYGHLSEACPEKVVTDVLNHDTVTVTTAQEGTMQVADDPESDPKFGPWMVVARKSRYSGNKENSKKNSVNQEVNQKDHASSRFGALSEKVVTENTGEDSGVFTKSFENPYQFVTPDGAKNGQKNASKRPTTLGQPNFKSKGPTNVSNETFSNKPAVKPITKPRSTRTPLAEISKQPRAHDHNNRLPSSSSPPLVPTPVSLDARKHSAVATETAPNLYSRRPKKDQVNHTGHDPPNFSSKHDNIVDDMVTDEIVAHDENDALTNEETIAEIGSARIASEEQLEGC